MAALTVAHYPNTNTTQMAMTKLALAAVVLLGACACVAQAGPLYDYVHAPDPAFAWRDTGYRLNTTGPDGWTGYMLNLTSQTWLTPDATDRYTWTHQLMVFVPNGLKNYTIGSIYLTGGGNDVSICQHD